MITKEQRLRVLSKETGIIQGIIKRLGIDSFLIKGWTVSLIVATLIFQGDKYQVLVAFIPLFSFWFLDSYYQQQIKLYKKLYKWNVLNRMNTDEYMFDINVNDRFKKSVPSRAALMISDKLIWFYGAMIILTISYLCFTFYK